MWWWIYLLCGGVVASAFSWPVIVAWGLINGVVSGVLASYTYSTMLFIHATEGRGDSQRLQEIGWLKWQFVRTARFRIIATESVAKIEVTFFGLPMWAKWLAHYDNATQARREVDKQYQMLARATYLRGKQQRRVINVPPPSLWDDR